MHIIKLSDELVRKNIAFAADHNPLQLRINIITVQK